jgi:CBS domain-containing protein
LRDGDELRVGDAVFRVRGAVPADSPPLLVAWEGQEPAQARAAGGPLGNDSPRPTARKGAWPPAEPLRAHGLALEAATAAELMTPKVVSLPATATAEEAAAFLTDKGLNTVPVMGEDGRPVGVLSRTDVVAHASEDGRSVPPRAEGDGRAGAADSRVVVVEKVGPTQVRDIMTPFVFAVGPQTPAATVVGAILSLGVHHLFVADPQGGILGVISTIDVLRRLRPPAGPAQAARVPPVCLVPAQPA